MSFTLQQVVPWGRNLAEYKKMFALSDADLTKKILGVADGPASFNAELTLIGGSCISLDPVYQFQPDQIKNRIEETAGTMLIQLEENQDDYLWDDYRTVGNLFNLRLEAMQAFLQDFNKGKEEGRYLEASLPLLPFADQQIDLILSSYFLFTYEQHHSYEFHLNAIEEMIRVGEEIRIFPLVQLDGKPSTYLPDLIDALSRKDISIEIVPVSYRFQKGSDNMLVIKKM